MFTRATKRGPDGTILPGAGGLTADAAGGPQPGPGGAATPAVATAASTSATATSSEDMKYSNSSTTIERSRPPGQYAYAARRRPDKIKRNSNGTWEPVGDWAARKAHEEGSTRTAFHEAGHAVIGLAVGSGKVVDPAADAVAHCPAASDFPTDGNYPQDERGPSSPCGVGDWMHGCGFSPFVSA
jgi:hypothetical protein